MRAFLVLTLVGLMPHVHAEPIFLHMTADGTRCFFAGEFGVCQLDPADERGDPHLLVSIDPRPQRAADEVVACVVDRPCADPEDWVLVRTEIWRDTNGCDGLQTTDGPCGPADERVLFTDTTLP